MAKTSEVLRNQAITVVVAGIVGLLLFVGKIWVADVLGPLLDAGLPKISNSSLLSLALLQFLTIVLLITWVILLYRKLKKERKAASEGIGFAMISASPMSTTGE